MIVLIIGLSVKKEFVFIFTCENTIQKIKTYGMAVYNSIRLRDSAESKTSFGGCRNCFDNLEFGSLYLFRGSDLVLRV